MYNISLETTYATPYASSQFLSLILLSMASQKHTPDTKDSIKGTYDYIVVGAGSAGSVVASRLAEKECVSVLLLEAGKSPPKLTDLPAINKFFTHSDLDWKFKTVPQKYTGDGLIGRSPIMSGGKAIGGSSVINGMLSIRGNKDDYNSWAAQGATGWSYEEVLPYFKKLEDNTNSEFVKNDYHGVGGPVTMSKPPYDSELKAAINEAAKEMGYKILDSNGPKQSGFNDIQANMRNGQRCSAAKAYLVPSEKKSNLDIVAGAYVRKIMIKNYQAKGVILDFEGETLKVKARREVILSAGAIKSPHILMLSGIGPREELTKHKIPVVSDLPVGHNLQEQWGVLLDFELSDKIRSLSEKMMDFSNIWSYILSKTGPLASLSGVSNTAFLNTLGLQVPGDYPDYQLYFGEGIHSLVKTKLSIKSQYHKVIYKPYDKKPFYWCFSQILHPRGRGMVFLNSSDPYDYPLINPKYFSHPEDLDIIIDGMKKCKQIGASEPLRRIGSKPFSTVYPGCEDMFGDDDRYFRCIAKSIMITCSHPVGTVKMGSADDPQAVLDPQLRVKTIRNLRVVDASVMPTISSGNTNIPTMMIAEKASDMIKENIQCPARGQ